MGIDKRKMVYINNANGRMKMNQAHLGELVNHQIYRTLDRIIQLTIAGRISKKECTKRILSQTRFDKAK
jgi:hypothetical protein